MIFALLLNAVYEALTAGSWWRYFRGWRAYKHPFSEQGDFITWRPSTIKSRFIKEQISISFVKRWEYSFFCVGNVYRNSCCTGKGGTDWRNHKYYSNGIQGTKFPVILSSCETQRIDNDYGSPAYFRLLSHTRSGDLCCSSVLLVFAALNQCKIRNISSCLSWQKPCSMQHWNGFLFDNYSLCLSSFRYIVFYVGQGCYADSFVICLFSKKSRLKYHFLFAPLFPDVGDLI